MASDLQKTTVAVILIASFLAYTSFLYMSLPIKSYATSNACIEGKKTWQNYNCAACHQVYGLGGYLGPDLTNVYSKRGPQYIQAFISNGTNVMPNFHLSNNEQENLIAYFKNIDSSGKSDPKTFFVHNNGTIEQ